MTLGWRLVYLVKGMHTHFCLLRLRYSPRKSVHSHRHVGCWSATVCSTYRVFSIQYENWCRRSQAPYARYIVGSSRTGQGLTKSSRDLINKLVRVLWKHRMKAEEAMQHEWFAELDVLGDTNESVKRASKCNTLTQADLVIDAIENASHESRHAKNSTIAVLLLCPQQLWRILGKLALYPRQEH